MISLFLLLFVYILGGVTFLPLLAISSYYWLFMPSNSPVQQVGLDEKNQLNDSFVTEERHTQKGWIRLTNQYQPKMPEAAGKLMSGIQSIVSQGACQPKGMFYAVLKRENLVCYESEKQQQIVMTLNLKEYNVSIYPKTKIEGDMYGRAATLRLVPKQLMKDVEAEDIKDNKSIFSCILSDDDITYSSNRVLYLNCPRRMDKEDWYFGILDAQNTISDPIKSAQYVMIDNTHFSVTSIDRLIRQVQSNQSHRDTAWLNAVLGRIFLAMYKTDRLNEMMAEKLRKKIDKTKRPNFLDEILIRSVDVGESVPFITDPKLLSLTPQGEVLVEASVEYRGGLTIEIETNLNWSYSSRMKPIRMNLILSAKLRKLTGKLMFKLKAPPTNRYWLAFFEMPDMEWKITPVVADKEIKWSLVTKTIEAKIREIMMESFVLPNMDDTAFCPSDGKGGIFGEYVARSLHTVHSRSSSVSSLTSITGSVASSIKSSLFDNNNNSDNNNNNNNNSSNNGGVSEKNNRSSINNTIRENPSVPKIREKPNASDALKLNARRAESVSGITITTTDINNDTITVPLSADSAKSLPSLPRVSEDSSSDFDEINWSSASSSKQSINGEEEKVCNHRFLHSRSPYRYSDSSLDISSVRSNSTQDSISGPRRSSVHTQDSVNTRRSSSSGLLNKKKGGLFSRAENFISKKISSGPDYTPLDDEKREQYAERLAQMRQRSLEKSLDANKLPDLDANSLNSFVKPEINANEPPLPPLPPLPPRYEANGSPSLDSLIINEPVNSIPPPLPTTPRPNLHKV